MGVPLKNKFCPLESNLDTLEEMMMRTIKEIVDRMYRGEYSAEDQWDLIRHYNKLNSQFEIIYQTLELSQQVKDLEKAVENNEQFANEHYNEYLK